MIVVELATVAAVVAAAAVYPCCRPWLVVAVVSADLGSS